MKIIEKRMDLFEISLDYTLVHCISEDCAMGAGIAKTFNRRYGKMQQDLRNELKINMLNYPISIFYHESSEKHDVINMITKERYWHKPTYNNFLHALLDVVEICKSKNIKKIAMPKIGCGLDRLEWEKVRGFIEDYFEDLDVEIVVCYL